jgi:hypothetical protein
MKDSFARQRKGLARYRKAAVTCLHSHLDRWKDRLLESTALDAAAS